ncbi:hypothetical protein KUCAC02_026545, partial [Chaenocephalus aceratus]
SLFFLHRGNKASQEIRDRQNSGNSDNNHLWFHDSAASLRRVQPFDFPSGRGSDSRLYVCAGLR